MWRHLAGHAWTGPHRASAIASLRVLKSVYERRRRHHFRAQAIAHALAALEGPPPA
jgi:hypothetical protein